MPGFTMSFEYDHADDCVPSATPAACRPARDHVDDARAASSGTAPPCSATSLATASARPCGSRDRPAVDAAHAGLGGEGDELARCGRSRGVEARTAPAREVRRSTLALGVSSAKPTSSAARRPALRSSTRRTGTNCVAWRLPTVIVPVLSSSSASTSPAASTAGRSWPARCAAEPDPCRRCRSPTAIRRSSSGSGRPAVPRARCSDWPRVRRVDARTAAA